MSDRFSDPSWWPQPPPKPLKATSTSMLLLGVLAAVAVGAIVWTSAVGRSDQKAKPGATVSSTPLDGRAAFAQCMHNMGAGPGVQGRGRFGGGRPSASYRNAFEVCRSLLRPGQADPVAPPRTGTTPAPVA